jgi:hypothetical protein
VAAPARPPSCHYQQDFTYTTPASVQSGSSPSQISVQDEICQNGAQQVGTPFTFTPISPASPTVSVRALVDQATKTMDAPAPQASLSPDANATQYVGLPVWTWLPPTSWSRRSVSVSAGGVSLTMTATPVFSVWSMGDGGSVTCRGPGTPYPASSSRKPPRLSPDCGYTYTRSSSAEPGGVFPLQVTTHWSVSWSTTTGLTGSEPDLTATSSLGLHVSEIQALVTDVRP